MGEQELLCFRYILLFGIHCRCSRALPWGSFTELHSKHYSGVKCLDSAISKVKTLTQRWVSVQSSQLNIAMSCRIGGNLLCISHWYKRQTAAVSLAQSNPGLPVKHPSCVHITARPNNVWLSIFHTWKKNSNHWEKYLFHRIDLLLPSMLPILCTSHWSATILIIIHGKTISVLFDKQSCIIGL